METQNGKNDNQDLIPFLGVRRKWGAFALHIFVQFAFVYSIFVIHHHVASGWQDFKTIKAIVADIAPGIAAAAFIPILIFAEVEILMILYNIVKEQIEARQKKRIQKAEERGRAEGKALVQQEWREWLERKETAEAASESFNEPTPNVV